MGNAIIVAVVHCTRHLAEDVLGLFVLKRATLLNVCGQIAMSSKLQHHIGVVSAVDDVEEFFYVWVIQFFHNVEFFPIFIVTPLTMHKDFNCDFHICEGVANQLPLSKGPFTVGIEYDIVISNGLLFIGAGIHVQLHGLLLSDLAIQVLDNFHANANYGNQIQNNKK